MCSTLATTLLDYCPPIQVAVYSVSRGLNVKFAFLDDVNTGVNNLTYCLPEDETIVEFILSLILNS